MKIRHIIQTLPLILFFSGCASTQQPQLYTLRVPSNIPSMDIHAEHMKNALIIVERVRIPRRMDRPGIVTRANEVELVYSEFQRWGEPLDDNFSDILSLDLTLLLPNSIIWRDNAASRMKADYRVQVQVVRLIGKLGEEVELIARWSIFADKDSNLMKTAVSRYSAPLKDSSYNTYVTAVSELVMKLSEEIAISFQNQPVPNEKR